MRRQPQHIGHISAYAAPVGAHELNATADQACDLNAGGGRARGDANDDHSPAVSCHHEGIHHRVRPSQGFDGDVNAAPAGQPFDLGNDVGRCRIDGDRGTEPA